MRSTYANSAIFRAFAVIRAVCMALFILLMLAAPALAYNGPQRSVPELDAGSVGSALTLLAGVMMILRDRRCKK